MENSLKYQVRSREIIDLVSAMRSNRLTLSAYFQRNLVWRDTHKRDFIDTILMGFPFPQVFLARGPINLETMEASTCVVDGQQRLTAIREFIAGDLEVNGQAFSQLSDRTREEFLKYEVPVIDFDLDASDPRLKDIFKRLNRTFYALSTIEKIASEYSASQFLLVARILSGDFTNQVAQVEMEIEEDIFPDQAKEDEARVEKNAFLVDPGVEDATLQWLNERADGSFSRLVGEEKIFSYYETQRKVPLMFVLNVMSTLIAGYYNRNAQIKDYLERYNSEFPEADEILQKLNRAADYISALGLPDKSMWWNKANFFSLCVEVAKNLDALAAADASGASLRAFEENVPGEYSLAAREAVNNRNQRVLRGRYVREAITGVPQDQEAAEGASAPAVAASGEEEGGARAS
jgi:hypothetical protein